MHQYGEFYENHMTKDMQEIIEITINQDKLKEEYTHCHEMYMKAKQAGRISLPCESVNGDDVLHGARRQVHRIERYWETRRDIAAQFLPQEWLMEKREEMYNETN